MGPHTGPAMTPASSNQLALPPKRLNFPICRMEVTAAPVSLRFPYGCLNRRPQRTAAETNIAGDVQPRAMVLMI